MATSGVVTYTATGTEIVRRAYLILGHIDEAGSPSSAQSSDALIALNHLVKSWSGQNDFAPGLKTWTRRRAVLFPSITASAYTLGPGGDHATETYARTTLTAAASGTSLTVASITGITNGDFLAVELPTGALSWTTVNGVPSGSTVVAAASITADSGAVVYAYTTKMRKPLDVQSVKYMSYDGTELTYLVPVSLAKYDTFTTTKEEGTPYYYLFEEGRLTSSFRVDAYPEDVTKLLHITYLSAIEDFSSASNDCDYPQVWFRPLALGLAKDLAPGGAWTPDLESKLAEALMYARNANPQRDESFFEAAT